MLRVEYDVGRSQSICVPALCTCQSAENEHLQMKIKRVEEYCEITNLLAENAHTTTTARARSTNTIEACSNQPRRYTCHFEVNGVEER